EVVIGGDEVVVGVAAEVDEAVVDRQLGAGGNGRDLGCDAGMRDQPVEDLEASATTLPSEGVFRVGQALQLRQHELRQDQLAVEEVGVGDIDDAAIDDGRGVDHFVLGSMVDV